MKRIISLIITILLLFCLTACKGTYSQVDLKAPVTIPEDGIIEKNVFDRIKEEGAIATFTGDNGGLGYEWIVFGSEITDTRDVNFKVGLAKTEKGIALSFAETEDIGFPVHLSVYLDEKWTADSATAYVGEEPVYSVSVTGSGETVLNLLIDRIAEKCEIISDVAAEGTSAGEEAFETKKKETEAQSEEEKETAETSVRNEASSEEPSETTAYQSTVKDEKPADTTQTVVTSKAPEPDKEIQITANETTASKETKPAGDREYSNGNSEGKDKYNTDPVPEGKPMPVEPEDQEVDKKKTYICTFSIECSAILNNLSDLDPDKLELIPAGGVILAPAKVTFYEGESVFDVLQRVCKENGIHIEASWTPMYNSAYVEGINNLYEFDCGELSGWMYRVNGWYPNYGCSRYQLEDGEVVEWRFTCDLGKDIGGGWIEG